LARGATVLPYDGDARLGAACSDDAKIEVEVVLREPQPARFADSPAPRLIWVFA
jgi:hypothetical protein